MKLQHHLELGYALLLGVGSCFVTAPVGFSSYKALTYRGHDAALGWPFAGMALALLGWAWCCCDWELLLWRESRLGAALEKSTASVIFCSGLVALALALGLALIWL